jgi:hypothetical protein
VLADGEVVGRIMHAGFGTPEGRPWLWSLRYGFHRDRTPSYGYEPTREAAMAAFAKSWLRELARRLHYVRFAPLARDLCAARQTTFSAMKRHRSLDWKTALRVLAALG